MEHNYLKISDIGKVITGKTPSTEDTNNFDGKYPFITPSDIKTYSEKYLLDTERTLSDLGADTLKGNILPKNTICFVCIGSTIGKMCMTNCESFTNQQINSLIPFPGYDNNFIFYILRYVKSYFQSIGGGTGSGKGIVNKTVFSKTKLDIPFNLETQKRIAEILSAYDSLIELNTKRIKTLEQMAENLYKEWFVRFRFPGHENAEFENGIPKEWEYKTAAELSSVLQRGISPDYDDDGEYIVISQKCIRTNIMDISESRRQTKAFKPELNLQDADTVICSTGTGTLGRVGRVIGSYPNITFDSHVTLVRAKKNVSKQFLYGALKNTQTWFMNMGIGSTNQQELYISVIRKTKLLVPTDNLMKDYENIVKPIHDNIGILISDNENLIKQRDLLLPRLMSGKLEV